MIKIMGTVVTVHVMIAYGVNGVIVKPILNFGTRWMFGLPHVSVPLPQGNRPKLPIYYETGLHQGQRWTISSREITLSFPVFKPRTLQPLS